MRKIKTRFAIILIALLFSGINANAQCREMNVNQLTGTLKSLLLPSLSIKLDRDDSRFSILGRTERFAIPAENISKPARDWRYHVQDLNSDDSNLWFDKNQKNFVLDVRFEGDDSEIKGICPGCLRRFRDRRAPDVNWKGARIARLRFNPIPYNGTVSIEIVGVELFGEFDINGPLESFFPRMVRNIENRIKRDIQNKGATLLNNNAIKQRIGREIRPLIQALGINSVRRIQITTNGQKIQFCS